MNKTALTETVKTFGRFIYFGVLGLVATFLASLVAGGTLNDIAITLGGQSFNVGFVIVVVVAGIAKAIDRYVHTNDNIEANGIAPF